MMPSSEAVIDTLARFDAPVPRYTSYPTAPHFGPEVGPEAYARWLRGLAPGAPVSVYVHIPFCRELCWFCGCHTKIVRRYTPIARYLEALHGEIDAVAAHLGPGRPAGHVHFGGGSPDILEPDDIVALTARLRALFPPLAGAELAVEIDPRVFSEAKAEALGAAGFVRASLGIQDFDPKVQRAIGRLQSEAQTADAVAWLREHGVRHINFDLMYGLPHQSIAGLLRTVDTALAMAPDRIAVFGYAHVPWVKRHQRLIDESALPDTRARIALFLAVARRLEARGMRWIGLDHFARRDDGLARAAAAGRLKRNFQGYTDDEAEVLIGLGASAIGTLPQGYAQNSAAINAYVETARAGRLAIARGIRLNDDDRLRRAVIERLMCELAVDVEPLCRRFGRDPAALAPALAALGPLARAGLVEVAGLRVAVTPAGRPALRLAASAFDAYLERAPARHSRAL